MSTRNRPRGARRSGNDGAPKSKPADKAAPKAIRSGGGATRSGGSGVRKSGGNIAPILRPEPPAPESSKAKAKSLPGRPLLKRKASGKIESTSKRSKKSEPDQEADEEEDGYSVRKDIISTMAPLLDEISNVLLLFGLHSPMAWYKALEKRRTKIEEACKTVSNRLELMTHKSLEASFSLGSAPGLGAAGKKLAALFQAMERHRLACITQSKSYPPSIYCQTPFWQQCQNDPKLVIRAGRGKVPISFPLPLPLIHPAFRLFVFWMRSPPDLDFKSEPCNSLFRVAQCVDTLLLSMPAIYWTHDQRLQAFKEALAIAFPENENFEWYTNCATSLDPSNPTGARERVDLVYRDRNTLVALIFVEVKLEPGKGGDPFWQNGRIYQLYVEQNPEARKNGAPVFFIQLSGIHMDVGGAFCDPQGGPPVILPMGGSKVLQFDYLGWHRREAIHALWALHESIQLLNVESEVKSDNLLTPQFIPKQLKITTTLDMGVVYLAKIVDIDGLPSFLADVSPKPVLIKIIYSGFHRQHYGSIVHRFLWTHDMAPRLYGTTSPVPEEFKQGAALESYIFMEYLPPPSGAKAGWISLHDLGVKYPSVAKDNKGQIVDAALEIAGKLKEGGFVHGDLRTNNLMIHVVLKQGGTVCQLKFLKDKRPRLKAIDFDWSGKRNEVYYPTLRNPAVTWPGQDGMCISADHDTEMVRLWSREWPQANIGRRRSFRQADRIDVA